MLVIHDVCLFLSDLLYSVSLTKPIHVATKGIVSFFFLQLNNIPLYMYHIFFIHSSADGHLGCHHVFTIVNSAAMNTGVCVSFDLWFSLGVCPTAGLLSYMVVLFCFVFQCFKTPSYCSP